MSIDDLILYAALVGYLLAAVSYMLDVAGGRVNVGRTATAATVTALGLHTLALAWRMAGQFRHWGPSESLSFFAWSIALIYLIIELRYHNRVLGALVLPLVVLAGSAAAAVPQRLHQLAPGLLGVKPFVHVGLAILGNAAFAVTCCTGVMYLFQERQLKSRHFGKMAFRLPPLEQLDDIGIKSILVGFPLHTLALVSGFLWAERARGSFFQLRPLEIWSVVSWLIYAGLLYARVSAGWRGRKAAILAILGFCLVLLTFISVKVIGPGAGG
jgi:cytochrome c-type biogenesis protein CcsB